MDFINIVYNGINIRGKYFLCRNYSTHRLLSNPLMGQYHIKYQLYMKYLKSYNMNTFVKYTILQECLHNAIYILKLCYKGNIRIFVEKNLI